jgi:F-type H+-transporting ATPase subunit a
MSAETSNATSEAAHHLVKIFDFEFNPIVKWFGLDFNILILIMIWIVMLILILISWYASRKIQWIPRGWQNILEYAVEFIQNMVKGSLGDAGVKYTYFFGSLFLFILVSNMMGLIPVPGFVSPTRDVSVTLSLAVLWTIWAQYISIRENGLKGYIKHYFQPIAPFVAIHLMEMVVRPMTLALRLFGNIYAGEILLEKFTEKFPVLVPSLWIFISIAIGGIQAFIFTVLTVSYTGLSVSHEDNSHSSAGEHSH